MRIAVTGAGGFIGSALVERLLEGADASSATVVAVDTDLSGLARRPRLEIVEGDICDFVVQAAATDGVDLLFHLASIPGGAAERDEALSWRVNVEAAAALLHAMAGRTPMARVVYASTIAVFGAPLPALVDDATTPRPTLTYGSHKLIVEVLLADLVRRGGLEGVALRLPAILARPRSPSGLISAFMSDMVHAAASHEAFDCPVAAGATNWFMSRRRAVDNLLHSAGLPAAALNQAPAAVTLPALRLSMSDLAAALAEVVDPGFAGRVGYRSDAALEAQFGAQPPLLTEAADRLGFRADVDAAALARAALPETSR